MKTLFVGQNSIHLKSVDSTNSYATELLRQIKPVEGSVIYTFEQQNGRGQRGNSWESEPNKNVALSVILYPAFLTTDNQFLLNKITSLAIADLMAEMLLNSGKSNIVKIKWPNDVYVDKQKIAGVLIENSLRENSIQSTVIGIGMNINQSEFAVELKNPVSLKMLEGIDFDLKNCVEKLCEYMEARYLQLKTNKVEKINTDYLNCLYQYNEWYSYKINSEIVNGKIIGVSLFGKLQVLFESNEIKEFDLKEIEFL